MKQRARSDSWLRRMMERLKRLFERKPEPLEPEDPHSYRMAPLRRGPRDRSGAAVADPDEE